AEYREPCAQCSAVDWGISDEGRFYCRSCHNVIERTREVMDMSFTRDSNRISWISSKSRTRKTDRGNVWMLCEVFQFILKNQADALLRLGVSPGFKDDVLCQLWRLYLQKSQQAYTRNPVNSLKFKWVSFLFINHFVDFYFFKIIFSHNFFYLFSDFCHIFTYLFLLFFDTFFT
ncbi:hypothetical protein AMECASPLE_037859, partial [Ameca splendens]